VPNTELFDQLVDTILRYKTSSQLKGFLVAILTPKEMEEIPTRLQIVKMLKNGVSQRTISKELGVGVATITRGSSELKKGNFSDID